MSTFVTAEELQVVPAGRDPLKAARAMTEIQTARRNTRPGRRALKVPALELPVSVVDALEAMLEELAQGHAVIVSTPEREDSELSTTAAAACLGMSRPTLINLLETGEIPYRMVGTHRRVRFSDVAAYKKRMAGPVDDAAARRRRRLRGLREMAKISHEAGEGY